MGYQGGAPRSWIAGGSVETMISIKGITFCVGLRTSGILRASAFLSTLALLKTGYKFAFIRSFIGLLTGYKHAGVSRFLLIADYRLHLSLVFYCYEQGISHHFYLVS